MVKHRRQKSASTVKRPPLTLTITDLSRGGAGVGHDEEGRAVFVPFTLPGDLVLVRLNKLKRRYAEGLMLELIEHSPLRAEPRCPAFTRCGGCDWQHVPYELQWQTKEAGVRESLRLAKVQAPDDWQGFPAQQTWNYRNRIQLRGQGNSIGFYARQSNTLVSIENCDIVQPAINAELPSVRDAGNAMNASYKVELSLATDGSVQRLWNAQHAAGGFHQVNDKQNEKLQAWIASSLSRADGLLDLFGGNGNLSLPLLSKISEIHCVDISSPVSTNSSQPGTIQFHRSPVLPWLRQRQSLLRQKKISVTDQVWTALIDPPRGGLGEEAEEIILALTELAVSTVVLVGCKTDPWSRDVAHFVNQGWQLRKLAVFDFFPQTSHVESVALLTR